MNLFKKGIYWNLFRTLIERGFVFFQQILLAWFLLPKDFGFFSSISSLLAICSLFAVIGINETLTNRYKCVSFWEPVFNSINYLLIGFSFLLYIVVALILYGNDINEITLIFVYGISILFLGLKSIDIVKLSVFGNYKYINLSRIAYTTSLVLGSLILAYFDYGVFSLIIPASISSFLEFLFLRIKAKSSFSFSKNIYAIKKFFSKSLQLMGYNVSWRIINFLDFILIGILLDDKKAGLYFMAFNLSVQPLNLFISYLPSVLFSSNIRDKMNQSETILRIQKTTLMLTFICTPFFIGLYFFSNDIVTFLFNENWSNTTPILKMLSLAMIPRVLSSQWYLIPLVNSNYNYMSRISLIFLAVFLILFTSGTLFFDIKGAAISILIFYFLTIYLSLNYLIFENVYLKENITLLLNGALSFWFSYLLYSLNSTLSTLALSIVLSIALYFILIYFTCPKTNQIINQNFKFKKS